MPDAVARVVVVNTTPIIALAIVEQMRLLQLLYGEVWIPPEVRAELMAGGSRPGAVDFADVPFVRVGSLQDPSSARLLSDLDLGEAEVIVLARELRADLVIIDERLARRHAARLGLTVTGVLGVLIRAKQTGHVPSVKPLIVQLLAGGIFLGDDLIARALALAGEAD